MDRNGPITIVRVPPNTCPNCKREAVTPYATDGARYSTNELIGFYRCPDCGFVWETTWRIEPVTPTREG